jgi:hypothetical protein
MELTAAGPLAGLLNDFLEGSVLKVQQNLKPGF